MPSVDLSENVANALMTETMGNIQQTNAASRDSSQIANAHMKYASARKFDELDTVESRAVSGVMATPIASPATQTGGGTP